MKATDSERQRALATITPSVRAAATYWAPRSSWPPRSSRSKSDRTAFSVRSADCCGPVRRKPTYQENSFVLDRTQLVALWQRETEAAGYGAGGTGMIFM